MVFRRTLFLDRKKLTDFRCSGSHKIMTDRSTSTPPHNKPQSELKPRFKSQTSNLGCSFGVFELREGAVSDPGTFVKTAGLKVQL